MKCLRAVLFSALLGAAPLFAQPPAYPPAQLDRLVARIALYPDPLLAQVLAAATFADQIPDAARWAGQHRDLAGQALAEAMRARPLPWDPAVIALLPFPLVLDAMASDKPWTTQLGDAFLAQQSEILDAIQRQRRLAKQFGYLKTNDRVVVGSEPCTIMPVNPGHISVPSYDAQAVFVAPKPGVAADRAVRFDIEVTVGGFQPLGWESRNFEVIGGYFQAWGWGRGGVDWGARTVIINHAPWRMTWLNRHDYVHPYPTLQRVSPAQ